MSFKLWNYMNYKTKQEHFWAGKFGTEYITRNFTEKLLHSKMIMWGEILKSTSNVKTIKEFGCNIGLNLVALKKLNPNFSLVGYEINKEAAKEAIKTETAKIYTKSIIEELSDEPADMAFTAGVLIHINPKYINKVYENLVKGTKRYIVIAEYYNPTPVSINYRGFKNKLFKRDFAGDLIDNYGLNLINYGFIYKRDELTPQDDINWFLLEK